MCLQASLLSLRNLSLIKSCSFSGVLCTPICVAQIQRCWVVTKILFLWLLLLCSRKLPLVALPEYDPNTMPIANWTGTRCSDHETIWKITRRVPNSRHWITWCGIIERLGWTSKKEAFLGFRDFLYLGARDVNDFVHRTFLSSFPVESAKNLRQLFRLDH